MNGIVVFLVVVSVAAGQDVSADTWHSWKARYRKVYSNDREAASRQEIWRRNSERISHHNSGNHSFTIKLNQFADLSEEEFQSSVLSPFNLTVGNYGSKLHVSRNKSSYPTSMDWRERGFVTEVKDQGVKCKSSWAFSAVGALEGQNFKKSGFLLDLSVQEVIDCSWLYGNRGCHGGLATSVYDYVNREHGLCSSSSYSYLGYMWHCMASYCKKVAHCSGYRAIQSNSEADLLDALYTVGPLSVSVDASSFSFKYYHGGIYVDDSCSNKKLNHAMLLMGYGSYGEQDYWIVKNSWGTTWGNQGYMRLARNKNNMCGIATAAAYPTVS